MSNELLTKYFVGAGIVIVGLILYLILSWIGGRYKEKNGELLPVFLNLLCYLDLC